MFIPLACEATEISAGFLIVTAFFLSLSDYSYHMNNSLASSNLTYQLYDGPRTKTRLSKAENPLNTAIGTIVGCRTHTAPITVRPRIVARIIGKGPLCVIMFAELGHTTRIEPVREAELRNGEKKS